jgi:hypothetical protein
MNGTHRTARVGSSEERRGLKHSAFPFRFVSKFLSSFSILWTPIRYFYVDIPHCSYVFFSLMVSLFSFFFSRLLIEAFGKGRITFRLTIARDGF